MSFATNERKQVTTYKELIIAFVVFTLVLVALYPKNLLEEHILRENSNYDLSMLYLENMLKNDPTNEKLMLSLATQSLRSGRKDLAAKLLALLHKSEDPQILYKAYRESYALEKEDYFYFLAKKEIKEQKKHFKTLTRLFDTISSEHYYSNEEYDYMLNESLFLRKPEQAFYFALAKKDENRVEIAQMEKVYYLALEQNNLDYSLKAVDLEVSQDKQHQKKWREAKYYLLVKFYSRDEVVSYIKTKTQKSHFWKEKLAEYYFSQKEFKNSADIYMEGLHGSSDYEEQKFYFKKTIDTLAAGRQKNDVLRVAKRYENHFFHDKSMRKYLLKTYIANGKPEYAAALSKKILQRRY